MKLVNTTKTKKYTAAKAISLMLAAILLLTSVCSCSGSTVSSEKEVGTVGEWSVCYDEFYYLAQNYQNSLKDTYAEGSEELRNAVLDSVKENIVTNYAILELCQSNGLSYDEKELKDEVKKNIDLHITSDFDGSKKEYKKSLDEQGLTEHYVRFAGGVDILYNRLGTEYRSSGKLPSDDASIKKYINENFVHTWHITVFVNSEDERQEKLAKANEALALLESGERSMFELIGSVYNEDLTPDPLVSTYGYYFPKGVMDKAYEDAAFALKVNSRSQIVPGKCETANGRLSDCFYIIERLPQSEAEINANIGTLSDLMASAAISSDMEKLKEELSFEANEYCSSLDILSLKAPKDEGNIGIIITVAAIILVCAAAIIAFIVIRRIRIKKFHKTVKNMLSEKKK